MTDNEIIKALECCYGDEKDYANIIGNIHDNPELLGGESNGNII